MNSFTLAESESLATFALEFAQKQGAHQSEVRLSLAEGFSLNVREQDVETFEHTHEKNLSVTVYLNQRTGTALTSDLSRESIESAVNKACTIARYTTEDPYAGLAGPELLAKNFSDLDLYHPWDISATDAIALAVQCEKTARSIDKHITKMDGVAFDTHNYFTIYGNSNGFLHAYPSSRHSMSCAPIAEMNNEMQRDYDYTVARDKSDLCSVELLAKQAVARALRRLGAKQLKTTRCPVIFEAPVARSLLSHFIQAISGGNLYRKSSFLLDHLGETVFPSFVRIWQEPHLKSAWGSANYDNDGVATRQIDFVNQGKLASYVLGHYSARKLGLQTTGNAGGVYNLFMQHSDKSFNELLKQMQRGLIVTELMGQGVNLLTGDYSRGAFGFWVEEGEIQYPVEEITIAGNLKDLFANVLAIGKDIDTRSNIQTGSILINEMMVAGC